MNDIALLMTRPQPAPAAGPQGSKTAEAEAQPSRFAVPDEQETPLIVEALREPTMPEDELELYLEVDGELLLAPVVETASAPLLGAIRAELALDFTAESTEVGELLAPEEASVTELAAVSPALLSEDAVQPLTDAEMPVIEVQEHSVSEVVPPRLASSLVRTAPAPMPQSVPAPIATLEAAPIAPKAEAAPLVPSEVPAPSANPVAVNAEKSPVFEALLPVALSEEAPLSARVGSSVELQSTAAKETVAPPPPPRSEPSPLTRNVLERMQALELAEGQTRIFLRPRGLGAMEFDLSQLADGRMRLAIRVENPLILEALRAESSLLGQFMGERGFNLSHGEPEFEAYQGAASQDEGGALEEAALETAPLPATAIVSDRAVDILT